MVFFILISCSDETIQPRTIPPVTPVPQVNQILEGTGDIPAFPGAQGFGSHTIGGRGGRIYTVTNLNASGPGSFREACEASGPRIVVFNTGGTINLDSPIRITNPYITIAGQTAPGDGICIRGATLSIVTHNVVVRGLRIRVGDEPGGQDPEIRDGISLGQAGPNQTFNVIIDHCSISWAIDENTSLNWNVHNVSFQWNIIGEGLWFSTHPKGPHSMGMLIGNNNVSKVSIMNNYFVHNNARNPLASDNVSMELVNNLVYNYGNAATNLAPGTQVNAVGNYYKSGSNTPPFTPGSRQNGILLEPSPSGPAISLYVKSNISDGRPSDTGNEWLVVAGDNDERSRSFQPITAIESGTASVELVENVPDLILSEVGARAPHLDEVDLRLINDFYDNTGSIINSQAEVGGWPEYLTGEEVLDSDGDAMPDEWEIEKGLDPEDPSDAHLDRDNDGYTNIEEYINNFFN